MLRWLVIAGGVVITSLVVATSYSTSSYAAVFDMTKFSPTSQNMTIAMPGGGTEVDVAKHYLIKSQHGDVKRVELGIYFASEGQKVVDILHAGAAPPYANGGNGGIEGGVCQITTGHGTQDRVIVLFKNLQTHASISYNIPRDNICNGSSRANVPSENSSQYKLYASYKIPSSVLSGSKDIGANSTGTDKFKIQMIVTLNNGEQDDNLSFSVRSEPGSLVGYINTKNTTRNDTNNSLLGKRNNPTNGSPMKQRITFGLECNATESLMDAPVTVYDMDNQADSYPTGRFYIAAINKQGIAKPLTQEEYSMKSQDEDNGNVGRYEDDEDKYVFRPANGDENTSTIHIKKMEVGTKYVLVMFGMQVTSNFVYVGLPGDSIFGALNVDCPGWQATPDTTSSTPQIRKPGESIDWTHTVGKTGTADTDKPIAWEIRQFTKLPNGANVKGVIIPSGGANTIPAGKGSGTILDVSRSYTATSADLGKLVCQYIRIKPFARNSEAGKWKDADPVCRKVSNSPTGDFIPSADVSPDSGEPNEEYNWEVKVTGGIVPVSKWRTGDLEHQTQDSEITWIGHKYVYPPNISTTYNGASKDPNPFSLPAGANRYQEVHRSHASRSSNSAHDEDTNLESDLPSGSRVCYVSSVKLPRELKPALEWYDYGYDYYVDTTYNPDGTVNTPGHMEHYYDIRWFTRLKDESTRTWNHSAEACIMVGKRPRVQVRSEDLAVRGDITVHTSKFADIDGNKTFGSWVEYGAFSLGENVFIASGAAYREGSIGVLSDWSKLTFANTAAATGYGNLDALPDAPNIAEYFRTRATSSQSSIGATTVSGKQIIYSTSDVTINGDIINNDGPYAPGAVLPQMIIVAKNINITGNVQRIDAWLITIDDGAGLDSINTCIDVPIGTNLSDSLCANQLVVNGPVITKSLYLRRTFGARPGNERGVPSEIFNLRPDAFLWGYQQSSSDSVAQTVDISELPPRF